MNNIVTTGIFDLEKALLELPQIDFKVEHYFAEGTYTRVLFIPKDTVITGKIHRHSCTNILVAGKMRVISQDGEYDLVAPEFFVSGPGVKKAGVALEDSIWVNVHPWAGEPNVELIEQEIIVPEEEQIACLG